MLLPLNPPPYTVFKGEISRDKSWEIEVPVDYRKEFE